MNKIKRTGVILNFCSLLNKNQSIKQKTSFHGYVTYTKNIRQLATCILVLSMGVWVIFLTSCSTDIQNSSVTSEPSVIIDYNNATDQSQFPIDFTPYEKSTWDITNISLPRPFPDLPINYLRFLPQWLLNDFDDGSLVVGGDGIALNYQVWHEFISNISKNNDAVVTIQTFDIDSSKEAIDSTRYQKVSRYRLSVDSNQTVWEYLSDTKGDITGNFSIAYDGETGLHEVFVGEKKVFEFIYFLYDPKLSALYFGYMPLEELPYAYSKEDAAKDGCLIIDQGVIQNIDVLRNFGDAFEQYHDVGNFIRIFFEEDDNIKIMDIGFYNEHVFITVDYSRYSNRDKMEDVYVTTYYDNYVVAVEFDHDACSLDLGSDFRETIFIFEDVPYKKD